MCTVLSMCNSLDSPVLALARLGKLVNLDEDVSVYLPHNAQMDEGRCGFEFILKTLQKK